MDHLKEVQAYWDLRSHGFSDAINEEAESILGQEWTDYFRETLGESSLEILDDGAGAGFFSILLARLGHRVTSIDYSRGMVEKIKENLADRGLPSNALQMDAQALDFADASFDAVVQRNVMWNLDDPAQAYREIARVLKPGGVFIIDDGNHFWRATTRNMPPRTSVSGKNGGANARRTKPSPAATMPIIRSRWIFRSLSASPRSSPSASSGGPSGTWSS